MVIKAPWEEIAYVIGFAQAPAGRDPLSGPSVTEAEPQSEDAGATSPHLEKDDKRVAAAHTAPHALIIHELVREEGEQGLKRPAAALAWSGFAAGLSMGFSFLTLALIRSHLPDAPWRPLLDSAGYSVGFIIVILGRQQLFTETTVTAMLPLLIRRNRETLLSVLRFWAIVLATNLVGALCFAALISPVGLFADPIRQALIDTGREAVSGDFLPTMVRAMFAGWLIALMVWILPSARSARLFVILIITYVVALGRLSHTVAGTIDAAFVVFTGNGTIASFFGRFLIPTLIGNTVGGVALVALLNHAPLVGALQNDSDHADDASQDG
jgi:formate/nitrite transporter FocA (FNT family)